MDYRQFRLEDVRCQAGVSIFRRDSGTDEYTLVIYPLCYQPIAEQLRDLEAAYDQILDRLAIGRETAFVRRLFASDLVNQREELERSSLVRGGPDDLCAISLVRQPPLPDGKVAMIAYHVVGGEGDLSGDSTCLVRRSHGRTHAFLTQLCAAEVESSREQTEVIFGELDAKLSELDMTLEADVIRTWLYVQNVDANYAGMVRARREHFARHGLTADTHYVASTGIEGTYDDPRVKVLMDVYAVGGLAREQIQYIEARSHLNPTHEYGVTFERGTAVDYGDRRHVYISGTASIDNRGQIVHVGNVARQFDRMFENIGALLANADASLDDMAYLLVYIRDPSDYALVRQRLDERFPQLPSVIVAGAVCRPGWLIEAEGRAIVPADRPEFAPF